MSTKAAGLATKMGFTNVKVMLQGEPGWEKSGRPLVASHSFVEKGNIVLVDLRAPEKAASGHIPRAVNIPSAELEDREDDFPANRSAPIVLYGDSEQAEEAWEEVRDWGYKNVSLVDGGMSGWTARGGQLAAGAPGAEIHWVRQLGPGEVGVAEFRQAAAAPGSGQVILDVRTKEEAEEGRFPGALHIPLDEIEARLAEVPRDKEILLHCTTGSRAEMARRALQKAGYNARFCVANVICENGDCTIEE